MLVSHLKQNLLLSLGKQDTTQNQVVYMYEHDTGYVELRKTLSLKCNSEFATKQFCTSLKQLFS